MPRVDDQKVYDDLVGLCYECVLDEGKWADLLARLMQATGHQQGGILSPLGQSSYGQLSEIYFYDPAIIAPYNQYYYQLDPGHLYVPRQAVGCWYHDFIDLGSKAIQRSPYYQEFHRAYGIGNISATKLYETGTSRAYLSLLTNADAKPPDDSQQALLKRLTKHLTTAGQLSERVQRLELNLAQRDLLLDNHPSSLWLLDSGGHIHYCNQQAAGHTASPDSALYVQASHLHSKQRDNQLQALIRRAGGKQSKGLAGWIRLGANPPLELLVTPVPATPAFNHPFQGPLVLLVLLDPRVQTNLLVDLFQLSPAEQRLAELLAQQLNPEACAERLGVSINTVRSQLRALFRKTSTSRQAELVSLIGRLHR